MHPRIMMNQHGFSLAETAIVLAVLAIVIGSLIPSFLSIRVSEQARATTQNLQTVMRSVAAFVQSSGCVPCPVPADQDPATVSVCGACATTNGLVPFNSLGLPASFAKDAYGRWLTYAVDTRLASHVSPTGASPVYGPSGFCSLTYSNTTSLNVQVGGSLQDKIAVMLLSHGANGRGAYRNSPEFANDRFAFPANALACNLSARQGAEKCNASTSRSFVAADQAQNTTDPFDDVYLYLGRDALVTYLGNLPCQGGPAW
jgi:prepilin-type N-terminal cleavage/methylation domain-containing protein